MENTTTIILSILIPVMFGFGGLFFGFFKISKDLENKLSTEIKNLDTKLSTEINKLDIKLSTEIKDVKTEIKEVEIKLTKKIDILDSKFNKLDDKWSQTREMFFNAEKENYENFNTIQKNIENIKREKQQYLKESHKINDKNK